MANFKVHRDGDLRACGASTIAEGQDFVFVNGKLWSVEDDPCSHGDGQLIASHTGIFINGKRVIVHTPDPAKIDDLGHEDTQTAEGSSNVFAYE